MNNDLILHFYQYRCKLSCHFKKDFKEKEQRLPCFVQDWDVCVVLALTAHILKLAVYEVHRNTHYTSYNTEGNHVELSSGFFVDTHSEKKATVFQCIT